MKATRNIGWVVAVCLLMAAPPLARGQADVLSQVPADAPIVIVVANVAALSKKLAMINDKLGLNRPELSDVLTFAKTMSGAANGVDDNGGIALVFTEVPDPAAGEPPAVMIVPVTDYAAFVANFPAGGGAGDGVTSMQVAGEPVFVKQAGKYAVLGPKQDVVAGVKLGGGDLVKRAGSLNGQTVKGSDALIYLDLEKLGPVMTPLLEMGIEQAMQNAELNPAMAGNAAMMKAMLSAYGDALKAILRDGEAAVLGVRITDAGIGLTQGAQFKAGSPLGLAFANAPAAEPSFEQLPGRPFMVAMSMNFKALPLKEWMADLAARFPADSPLGAIFAMSVKVMEVSGSQVQQAMYPPNLAGGAPSLFSSVAVYNSPAPAQFRDLYQQTIADMGKLNIEGMTYKTDYTASAKEVAGKKVDQFVVQVTMPPEAMAQMGPMAGLFLQPMNGNLVSLDKAVIITSGADDALLQEAITAAGGTGTLAKAAGLSDVRGALPGHRVAEGYLGVGTVMQMAGSLLMMFAPQMAINVPADLPPVGVSASVEAGGANMHYEVPMPVIIAVKNVVTSLMPPGAGGRAGAAAGPRAQPKPMVMVSKNVGVVTDADFDAAVLKSDKPVIVEFWAGWFGGSNDQAAVSSALADENKDIMVVRMDVDKNPKTVEAQKVEELPTVLVVKNGKIVKKLTGPAAKDKILAALHP